MHSVTFDKPHHRFQLNKIKIKTQRERETNKLTPKYIILNVLKSKPVSKSVHRLTY